MSGSVRLAVLPAWGEVLVGDRVEQEYQEEYIRGQQRAMKGLRYDNDGRSAHWGDNVSPGCASCKANRWVTVFIGRACNAPCSFCPQPVKPSRGSDEDEDGWVSTSFGRERYEDLKDKLIRAATAGSIVAVGYSGGEPLMYLQRIEDYAGVLGRRCPDLYQYAYTNGILFDESVAQRLRAAGIRELRFDLAATEFAPKIVRKLRVARKYFSRIGIEVPSLPGTLEGLTRHLDEIVEARVDQINLCEVVINRHNATAFAGDAYYIHNLYEGRGSVQLPAGVDPTSYRRVVPVESRRETYRILTRAEADKWPITINDCSQAVHYKPEQPY